MKKILPYILATVTLVSLSVPTFAAEIDTTATPSAYTIIAGEQTLDLSDLPQAPYEEENTIMVPLSKIAKALGYQVRWDPKTGAITVEDAYVQKATLLNGTEKVVFEGKLQIIDLSREIDNSVKTTIHNGCTYVPLEFFQEFLNDTTIEGTRITVAPMMCEINTNNIES